MNLTHFFYPQDFLSRNLRIYSALTLADAFSRTKIKRPYISTRPHLVLLSLVYHTVQWQVSRYHSPTVFSARPYDKAAFRILHYFSHISPASCLYNLSRLILFLCSFDYYIALSCFVLLCWFLKSFALVLIDLSSAQFRTQFDRGSGPSIWIGNRSFTCAYCWRDMPSAEPEARCSGWNSWLSISLPPKTAVSLLV